MTAPLLALSAVIGLAIGSFLNVVIWRVPRDQSIIRPASACSSCQQSLQARDNIPVISWLLLRGKCRYCAAPISPRYPLIEGGTAAAFVATTWWLGVTWLLLPLLYLAAIAIALATIDLTHHRLPDAIVLPSILIMAGSLTLIAWESGQWASLGRAGLGGVIFFAAYLLMALIYPAGMGLGDVKLAPVLGLILGWWGWGAILIGFFAAFLVGGAISAILMVRGSHGRKSGIPFGPFMFIGTYIGLLWGNDWWHGYLTAIGGG